MLQHFATDIWPEHLVLIAEGVARKTDFQVTSQFLWEPRVPDVRSKKVPQSFWMPSEGLWQVLE